MRMVGLRQTWNCASDRWFHFFPCLSNPARRSSICLKMVLVMLHLIYAGILFLLDKDLNETRIREPWYTSLYFLLFVATLVQYLYTAGSSPGYVIDAMRTANETNTLLRKTTMASNKDVLCRAKNGSLIVTVDENHLGRNRLEGDGTYWTKLVMETYPPGSHSRSWTCAYCNVVQPPRAKHCHDCAKCILQFDHHCVWLGTCIGQGNHCRFWWYICEETALCLWTSILYITYLKANISKAWWIDVIMILLLAALLISLIFLLLLVVFHSYLVLTNQTTYELVRRRRIPYLRMIPGRVHPFSKGVCRNLNDFCCAGSSIYKLEPLPTLLELEEMSKPYTCVDVLSCRRCC